jgi:TonB family protein
MWNDPNTNRVFIGLIGASIATHLIGVAVLPIAQAAHEPAHEPTAVAITFTPPPPPPPPVAEIATQAAPTTAAARTITPTTRRVATKPRPQPAPPNIATALPAPDAPAEADFTMTTMTNAGETSFAATDGARGGGTGELPAAARNPGRGEGRGLVALADLSRAPVAPALDVALERNYPAAARDAGAAGTAVVRVRIAATGRAEAVRILSATADEFGQACRRTLLGSVWQPPLDGDGTAVSTEISYTCRFEVAH